MRLLILLGPPGSGKGTQSHLLEEQGWARISTGDLLRQIINSENELSRKIKTTLAEGKLVKDEIVFELVKEELLKQKGKHIVLDGFPRNLSQAKMLMDFNKEYDIILILINLNEAEIIRRNTGRRMCKNCQKIYNIYLLPPKQDNKCDECGSEIIQRIDDKEEVIKERINIYNKEVKDVVGFYKNKLSIFEIDGNNEIEEIFNQIIGLVKTNK